MLHARVEFFMEICGDGWGFSMTSENLIHDRTTGSTKMPK
jgi:hypothetical protein